MALLISPVLALPPRFDRTEDWCCCNDGCRTHDLSLVTTSVPDAVPSTVRETTSKQPTACCGAECGNRLCGNRLNRCCQAITSVSVAASTSTTATATATATSGTGGMATFVGFLIEFLNAV
ncbi:hypothetical protein INS49_000956 [Diaporthe citri]|uniref:uncharacterized protein n=1 Tax=Diaporthe citri TaxID=83186 RepID=UPI001C804E42|nr:uncharacterized protein INS49_000956 [Diaporthe citri]KAG6366776.1 hypothetical protein INS49_000956 [Diaporthe citri]